MKRYTLIMLIITVAILPSIVSGCNGINTKQMELSETNYPGSIEVATSMITTRTITDKYIITKSPSTTSLPMIFYELLYISDYSIKAIIIDQYGKLNPAKNIVTSKQAVVDFNISPDGLEIVYKTIIDPDNRYDKLQIFHLHNQTEYTIGDGISITKNPVWSPDGTFIAYSYYKDDTSIRVEPTKNCLGENCSVKIFALYANEDYGAIRNPIWITETKVGFIIDRGKENDFCIGDIIQKDHICPITNVNIYYANVSMNQDKLLLLINEENTNQLYLFNYELFEKTGSVEITQITSAEESVLWPKWSADNMHLFYRKNDKNGDRYLVYAKYNQEENLLEEKYILSDRRLGGEVFFTEDEKMAAWIYYENDIDIYLCVTPIDIEKQMSKITCKKNVTYFNTLQWMP